MEKKNFSEIEIEVISFNQADIIRMSDGAGGGASGGGWVPGEDDLM